MERELPVLRWIADWKYGYGPMPGADTLLTTVIVDGKRVAGTLTFEELAAQQHWNALYEWFQAIRRTYPDIENTSEQFRIWCRASKLLHPPKDNGWIYCGDGKNLPKKDGFYWVSLSDRICGGRPEAAIQKCWFNEGSDAFSDYGKFVMAWRPMPDRYEMKPTDVVREID